MLCLFYPQWGGAAWAADTNSSDQPLCNNNESCTIEANESIKDNLIIDRNYQRFTNNGKIGDYTTRKNGITVRGGIKVDNFDNNGSIYKIDVSGDSSFGILTNNGNIDGGITIKDSKKYANVTSILNHGKIGGIDVINSAIDRLFNEKGDPNNKKYSNIYKISLDNSSIESFKNDTWSSIGDGGITIQNNSNIKKFVNESGATINGGIKVINSVIGGSGSPLLNRGVINGNIEISNDVKDNTKTTGNIENVGGRIGDVGNANITLTNVIMSAFINERYQRNGGIINGNITLNNSGIKSTFNNNDGAEIKGNISVTNKSSVNIFSNTGTITGGISLKDSTINIFTNGFAAVGIFTGEIKGEISLDTTSKIGSFINYAPIATLTNGGTINNITLGKTSTITTITNTGTTTNLINAGTISKLENKGTIDVLDNKGTINHLVLSGGNIAFLSNQGKILSQNGIHIDASGGKANITSYHLEIDKTASDFNAFKPSTTAKTQLFAAANIASDDLSHLVIKDSTGKNVTFGDKNGNFTFDITTGNNFEIGKEYNLANLVLNHDGSAYELKDSNGNLANVILKSSDSILEFNQSGGSFSVGVNTNKSNGFAILKNNLASMNHLIMMSDGGIYSYKNTNKPSSKVANSRIQNPLHNANYEITNAKEFYGTAPKVNEWINDDSYALTNSNQILDSSIESNSKDSGYFFFTPFLTHSTLYDSQNDSSGMNYGFIAGSNYQSESYLIGGHFGFSYGDIKSNRVDDNIMSVMAGIHYKHNLIYGMYVKVRGDFFYFSNDLKDTIANTKAKHNPFAFSLGANYGKEWNFDINGLDNILGLEGGLNYQAMSSPAFEFGGANEIYNASFLNLFYGDVNIRYAKKLTQDGNWMFDSTLGARILMTPFSKGSMRLSQKDYDIELTSDRLSGYVKLGIDYIINQSIALDLNYLGSFGDKSMSNSGFFNVRVWW